MILDIDFSWIYLFYNAINWHSINISFVASVVNDTENLEYWNTGILEYWNTGILKYWNTGMLEY